MELVVGHLQCGVLTLQMFAAVNSARREGIAASQTGHYGHCRCPRYLPPMPSVLSNTFLSAIQKMKIIPYNFDVSYCIFPSAEKISVFM